MQKKSMSWDTQSSPGSANSLRQQTQSSQHTSSSERKQAPSRIYHPQFMFRGTSGNNIPKTNSDHQETIMETASITTKTSSLLSSGNSSYTPTSMNSSQIERQLDDQFASDDEDDLYDMKQFAKQNKKIIVDFTRQIDRFTEGIQEEKPVKVGSVDEKQQQNNSRTSVLFLLVLIVLLFCAIFLGGSAAAEAKEKATSILHSSCWQQFKKENCNLNNPLGNLCRDLYECTMKETDPNMKNPIEPDKEISQESWIEEVVVTVLATIAGSYYMGVDKLRFVCQFIISVIGQIFKEIKEFRQRQQRQND